MDPMWAALCLCIFIASAAVLYNQVAKKIPYRYSSLMLGNDSIRLLRLTPNRDETADIQCELFEYSLQNSCEETHLYDALSYVWGNPHEQLPIFIHEHSFDVTVNLHAALLRLRNHSIERILWVDAICINQTDSKEKGQQIQSMAKIYGHANRVVVWLGEAEDDSDLALEEIRVARGKKPTNPLNEETIQPADETIQPADEAIQPAVLALLQRPWFRRIWVWEQHLITFVRITKVYLDTPRSCCSSTCPDYVWI
jgi:hypothetical protein